MKVETANRLVELRKQANLSQEDLAEKLDISRQAVSKWERAESAPDMENLIKLSNLYGISMDEMLSLEQSNKSIKIRGKEKKDDPWADFDKQPPMKKKQIAWASIAAMAALIWFTIFMFVYSRIYIARLGFFIIPVFYFLPVLLNKEQDNDEPET